MNSEFRFPWVQIQGNGIAHTLVEWGAYHSFTGSVSSMMLPHHVTNLVLSEMLY